jgi:hypothetical protein
MTELLRDKNGKVVGSLKQEGALTKLYTVGGRFLGSYNKSTKMTYDSTGAVYAQSNLLVSLLPLK